MIENRVTSGTTQTWLSTKAATMPGHSASPEPAWQVPPGGDDRTRSMTFHGGGAIPGASSGLEQNTGGWIHACESGCGGGLARASMLKMWLQWSLEGRRDKIQQMGT